MDYPLHPITGDYDNLTEAELAMLRESLRKNRLIVPIVIWRGQIVDGRHRARLCYELGIELRVTDITEKYPTEEEMIAYVQALNEHRRANTKPLTTAEKRARIEAALKANPNWSHLAIAKTLGVDDKTVASVRAELERRSEIPNVSTTGNNTRVDTKGRRQPARKPMRPVRKPMAPVEPPRDVEQSFAAAHDEPTNERQEPGSTAVSEQLTPATDAPPSDPPASSAIPASALVIDPLAAIDAALQEFDIVVTKLLPLARPAIEATAAIEITNTMGLDGGANLIYRVKRTRDVAAALEEYSRLDRDPIGVREAREIKKRAEDELGRLLIATEHTGLRVGPRTKKGTKIGAQTGLRLEQIRITPKQSMNLQRRRKDIDRQREASLPIAAE